ncbi:hypothetical protein BTW15_19200 [Pseudomonas syringae pv. tomato]|uniref:DUF4262 domain-containing protein n=2 Tax=Pseudomonas syringae group TaxID=136849 RepID=A0AAW4E0B9_PSESX|nr:MULTISPECIES: hypothetical protein [Pseudomonas syringae group]AVI87366.1 hypothetical protein XJ28_28490 [Pseudomonas syringae pv. tomato]MBH0138400.1 hypothetical protein [Pseudomonas syringae pv. tomato]MBI6701009.1 hypothetical protein [Pseudomonas syringae]MBI6714537.1 hypothetical protein [Pseudomonas syringae]MBI6734930.1 hypothetical protein [Pseudomonas syringae]
MAIEDVRKIQNTHDSRWANALLDVGWSLVGMTPGTTDEGHPWPMFTLGWSKEGEPVEPPRQDW